MKDLYGVPIKIGDEVVYTASGRYSQYLKTGTIVRIFTREDERDHSVKIKDNESGRIQQNERYPAEIMSVIPTKQVYPELFI